MNSGGPLSCAKMNNFKFSDELKEKLSGLEAKINKAPDWLVPPVEKSRMTSKIEELKEALKRAHEEVLVVGFLGGTGVGKSTIMNALAGKEIASTDYRRPHTESILIYHHFNKPVPEELLLLDLPFKVFEHSVDTVKSLMFCDMPDFDSIKPQHRTTVLNFLEKLDLLVWVVSPEKYADQAFYLFLKEAMQIKNPKNFFFVMNKIDMVNPADEPSGRERTISLVLESFSGYLSEFGIKEPVIFPISAKDAFSGLFLDPFNQWKLFKNAVYREWTSKEIQAIKEANIEQEIKRIARDLKDLSEVGQRTVDSLARYMEVINDFGVVLSRKVRNLARNCALLIIDEYLENSVLEGGVLFGPGALLHRILLRFGSKRKERKLEAPEGCLEGFKEVFKQLENRISSVAYTVKLPAEIKDEFSRLYNREFLWGRFYNEAETYLDLSAVRFKWNHSLLFKVAQFFTYFGLVVLFFLSMGQAWTVKESTFSKFLLAVFLKCFERLFSLDGFGAMMTLGILELLAGIYFVLKFRKSLQGLSQKFIETVEHEIVSLWEKILQDLREQIKAKQKEALSWISHE